MKRGLRALIWIMAGGFVAVGLAENAKISSGSRFRSLPQANKNILPGSNHFRDRFVVLDGGHFRMGSREVNGINPVEVVVKAYAICKYETTVGEYVAFLNATGWTGASDSEQFFREGRRMMVRAGQANRPVGHVSYEDARAFCGWLSQKWSCKVRLPTEKEWEYAARGGIAGARYPWGWGTPVGRACFATDGVVAVDATRPNPFGLYHMAGNVFEWCVPIKQKAGQGLVRGGSWAERSPKILHVANQVWIPLAYRGPDVGFRVVIDLPE